MATPAASAWHRRRHVLVTPKERVSPVNAETPAANINHAQDTFVPNSILRDAQSVNKQSGTWYQPEMAEAVSILKKTEVQDIKHRPLPFYKWHANANRSVLKVAFITFACLILGRFCQMFANILGAIVLTRRNSDMAYYNPPSILLFLLKSIATLLFAVTLITIHFLFTRSNASAPSSMRLGTSRLLNMILANLLTRARLLHIVACVSACVLQSCLLAYIIYGPIAVPDGLCGKRCVLSTAGAEAWRALPSWIDLTPHTNTAVLAGLVFSLFWHASGADTGALIPFHVSNLKRMRLQIARMVLLAAIPMVLISMPVVLIQIAFVDSQGAQTGGMSLYWLAIEALANIFASLSTSGLTLLSWSAFSIGAGQGRILMSECESNIEMDTLSQEAEPTMIHAKRNKYIELINIASEVRRGGGRDLQVDMDIVEELGGFLRVDKDVKGFPGFDDASGQVWRETLATFLGPLDDLSSSLREYNMQQSQMTDGGITKSGSLFIRPTTARSTIRCGPHGDLYHTLSVTQERMVVCCARVMAELFVASYDQDRYGFVQRTLPRATRSLLECKEQTSMFLRCREMTESQNMLYRDVGLLPKLKGTMLLRSDYDSIVAIDDAITQSMYHIVGRFRSHLFGYMDGMEVDWDHRLNKCLDAFLDYQLP